MDERWLEPPARWAVEMRDVWKRFRGNTALAGLNLRVPEGGVHGLLGPNGSGKTTTIRVLLGLMRADRGTIKVLGETIPDHLDQVVPRMGAIVEQPKFDPVLTIRRNLEILATSIGVPRSRVTEVLGEVGLAHRGDTRFRGASLGMKQRVAVAATLLKQPQLLIFDEPTNGLDPSGIHELRATMRELAAAGRTVVVSSHLLAEIEQIADSLSIVGRGRVLAEGHLSQFLGGQHPTVVVTVQGSLSDAHEVLRQAGFQASVVAHQLEVADTQPHLVAAALGRREIWPSSLTVRQQSLEQVYLDLTHGESLTAEQNREIAA